MELAPLVGFTVGVTAGRRAAEQARLLERRGARVVLGPAISSGPPDAGTDLRAATSALVAEPPHVLLLTTGMGTRAWIAEAEAAGLGETLREALAGAEVWARGPKASGAAVSAGLEVAWRAPNERSRDLLDRLAQHADPPKLRVAVQLDGRESPWLADAVAELGCDTVLVRPYRWSIPTDVRPAVRLAEAVRERHVDAVTFTSAPAVDNFVALARQAGQWPGVESALWDDVAAVCVGPVSAAACRAHGINAIEPDRPRTAGMVRALIDYLATQRAAIRLLDEDAVVSGSVVVIGDALVELSRLEARVFQALAARPGAVLSKATLAKQAWPGRAVEPHAVEAAVARLRQRLGPAGTAIETVVRRGYRLDAS